MLQHIHNSPSFIFGGIICICQDCMPSVLDRLDTWIWKVGHHCQIGWAPSFNFHQQHELCPLNCFWLSTIALAGKSNVDMSMTTLQVSLPTSTGV